MTEKKFASHGDLEQKKVSFEQLSEGVKVTYPSLSALEDLYFRLIGMQRASEGAYL